MAEHRWSILCHRGIVDKYTNLLSILEVTDEITLDPVEGPLPENAALPVDLHLVSMWVRSEPARPEKIWSAIKIIGPHGEEFAAGQPLEGDLERHPRTRLVFRLQAIPFYGAGTYWFDICAAPTLGGAQAHVARVPFMIKMKEGG